MAALLRSSVRSYRLHFTARISPLTTSAAEPKLRPQLSAEEDSNPNVSKTGILNYPLDITLKRLANSHRHSEIESLIEPYKKNPNITEETFYSTLIRSYGIAGMFKHASRLFDEMEEYGTPRTSLSFNALLSAFVASKKFDLVPKLFDGIPQRHASISPDQVSYSILIKSHCEMNALDAALLVLKRMEENHIQVATNHYTAIIDGLYKNGKADEADKLWEVMTEKGCVPDVAAYNVRIGYAHQRKPEDVLALMDEMFAKGLKPDTVSYNFLFASYGNNGRMEHALKVYQDLEENGCSPIGATFRLGIVYLCKIGDFEKAFEMFKDSMRCDKVPAFHQLKILVEGLTKCSKRKEAKEVISIVRAKFPGNVLDSWSKLEEKLGLL